MKWTISPLLAAGLILFVACTVVDRIIVRVPDWLAIPTLVVAVVLIVLGGLRQQRER